MEQQSIEMRKVVADGLIKLYISSGLLWLIAAALTYWVSPKILFAYAVLWVVSICGELVVLFRKESTTKAAMRMGIHYNKDPLTSSVKPEFRVDKLEAFLSLRKKFGYRLAEAILGIFWVLLIYSQVAVSSIYWGLLILYVTAFVISKFRSAKVARIAEAKKTEWGAMAYILALQDFFNKEAGG